MKQVKSFDIAGKKLSSGEMKTIMGGLATCTKEDRLLCFDSCDAECAPQGLDGFCNASCVCRCY